MPCRVCKVKPGVNCIGFRAWTLIPKTFHKARISDAREASALIDATPSFSITDADIAAIVAAERAELG